MSNIETAITVARLDIDWAELGRVFAEQSSSDQAAFLVGFYENVVDMQLAYIGSEPIFGNAGRDDVSDVIYNLAGLIRHSG